MSREEIVVSRERRRVSRKERGEEWDRAKE